MTLLSTTRAFCRSDVWLDWKSSRRLERFVRLKLTRLRIYLGSPPTRPPTYLYTKISMFSIFSNSPNAFFTRRSLCSAEQFQPNVGPYCALDPGVNASFFMPVGHLTIPATPQTLELGGSLPTSYSPFVVYLSTAIDCFGASESVLARPSSSQGGVVM